jgi:hypothetical protein
MSDHSVTMPYFRSVVSDPPLPGAPILPHLFENLGKIIEMNETINQQSNINEEILEANKTFMSMKYEEAGKPEKGKGKNTNKQLLKRLRIQSLKTRYHMEELRKLMNENDQLRTQKDNLELDLLDRVAKLEDHCFTPQSKQHSNDRNPTGNNKIDYDGTRGGPDSREGYQGERVSDRQHSVPNPPQVLPRGIRQRHPSSQNNARKGPSTLGECSYCNK